MKTKPSINLLVQYLNIYASRPISRISLYTEACPYKVSDGGYLCLGQHGVGGPGYSINSLIEDAPKWTVMHKLQH